MISSVLSLKTKPIHAWRELAAFLYLPADAIWITGWYCLLVDRSMIDPPIDIYLVFLVTSISAYLILRLLFSWDAPAPLRLGLGALCLLAALWLGESLLVYRVPTFDFNRILRDIWTSFRGSRALSVEFWSLACVIFIWVRCVLYTRQPVTHDTIMGRFQLGLFMILILGVIFDRMGLITLTSGLCIFIILGLSSLGLARIADINIYRGGRRLLFSWDLFLVLTGISTGIVLVAGLLSLLTGTWLILAVITLTDWLLTAIRFIFQMIVAPLVNFILAILYFLVELFYDVESRAQISQPDLSHIFDNIQDFEPFELADPTGEGLKAAQPYLLGILLSLIAVFIVIMLLRLPKKEIVGDADNVGEKTGGNVIKKIRKSINKRLQALLDRVSRQVSIRRVTAIFRAAHIRWIYQQFELFTARKGYPRPGATTPMEYQLKVAPLFTGHTDELALLTAAYQSVRYGELPETSEEVNRVVKAWDRMKRLKINRYEVSRKSRKPK